MSVRGRCPGAAVLVIAAAAALSSLPGQTAAEVRARVEPRIVDELDTARLTIRATGSDPGRLDLEALEQDFEVLTSQRTSQYRSVDGQVESWVEYQILLRPRRAGELTIPPVQVGADITEPISLEVRGIDPELRDAIDRMVFFETELTANPVYVQAQTVMVRRLYYASGAQIYSDLPGMPEIADAVVMPLGETTSASTMRDGRRYGVIEQRFAIFPERSGALTIPAISVTSSVRLQSGGRTRRSGVRIATEPMTLEVMPIPSQYPADEPWLPAEDVTLSDRWTPVNGRVDVGDPVDRTLSARVQGNVSSVIPPLQPALPDTHFRRYPEPPELSDDAAGDSVRGLREQTYAIIPTAPGTVNVAPTEVVWWDVTERRVRTARSPGRTLHITGAPVIQPADPSGAAAPSAEPATRPEPRTPPADVDVRSDQVPWPGPERRRNLWLAALGVVALSMLLWMLSHWLPAVGRWLPGGVRRGRWRALKSACRHGDAGVVHQALIAYLRAHYRLPQADAIKRFRDDGHGAVLDSLNASRYRPGQQATVTYREILDAARAIRRSRRERRQPLPALYD